MHSFEIEPSVRANSKTLPRIKEKGEGFALVWLDGYPPVSSKKWDLLGAMAKCSETKDVSLPYRPNYSVRVCIQYRDGDNMWYRSSAVMSYIRSQDRIEFGPTSHEACGSVRPTLPGTVVTDQREPPTSTVPEDSVSAGGTDQLASRIALDDSAKLAHQKSPWTLAPTIPQAFAQPPDWTFSGHRLESYWREVEEPTAEIDNPTERLSEDEIADEMVARFHSDLDPLWDGISTFGGSWELVLPSEMNWRKIKDRVLPVHQDGDSTLSLLRRCAISLEHALYKTHPRLSQRNVEQFWNSHQVMEFFRQFISREFGESWLDERTVRRAYFTLRGKLYDYIDYVKSGILVLLCYKLRSGLRIAPQAVL